MSNDYGSDFITITDDNGEEFELEHLDTTEVDGKLYMAFLPADMDEDDPDYGMILLEVLEEENGDQYFGSIDDNDELERVYEAFMDQLFDDEDEEEDDED